MAKTVTINGVQYLDVPSVQIPLASGSGTATFFDTSEATIDASKVLQGYVGFGVAGSIVGTMTAANVSQDSTTKVLSIS